MRISDWSSDVCCSDLDLHGDGPREDPCSIRLGREPLPGTETPFADELEVAWQANRNYVVGRHGAHLAQSRSDAHDELELCLLAHRQLELFSLALHGQLQFQLRRLDLHLARPVVLVALLVGDLEVHVVGAWLARKSTRLNSST